MWNISKTYAKCRWRRSRFWAFSIFHGCGTPGIFRIEYAVIRRGFLNVLMFFARRRPLVLLIRRKFVDAPTHTFASSLLILRTKAFASSTQQKSAAKMGVFLEAISAWKRYNGIVILLPILFLFVFVRETDYFIDIDWLPRLNLVYWNAFGTRPVLILFVYFRTFFNSSLVCILVTFHHIQETWFPFSRCSIRAEITFHNDFKRLVFTNYIVVELKADTKCWHKNLQFCFCLSVKILLI